MKYFKSKQKLLVFGILLMSLLIAPIFGLGLINSTNINQNESITININSLGSSATGQSIPALVIPEGQFDDARCKFDYELKDFLNELSLSEDEPTEEIKVIISFHDDLSKAEREEIITTILDSSEIIYNYDIIPAVSIKCSIYELVEKEELFRPFASIKKIYKSITYTNPVIVDTDPISSALSSGSYNNWWVDAVSASGLGYDGSGVKVAILDSGVYNHPDLSIASHANFVTGETSSTDLNGHGTHVAGIVASDGGSSGGKYRGIAPGASIINARAGNVFGGLEDADIIAAIEWSAGAGGADIISMSIGGGYPDGHDLISEAITAAVESGVICVSAAGNSGPGYFTGGSPGAAVDVITVGASDSSNSLASFSSWGPSLTYIGYPDVVAPGVNIISTDAKNSVISKEMRYTGNFLDFGADGDYVPLSGTSMATPVVAGALAILKDAFPTLTPETARIALIKGAQKLAGDDGEFLKSGAGLINVSASLNYLINLNNTQGKITNITKIFPDILPVKPYDLVHFPGDHQEYNLTFISAANKSFTVEIPTSTSGISFTIDETLLNFTDDTGINFSTLDIEIGQEVVPGIYNFTINMTSGGVVYDSANISLEIRLPEYKILMDSFHGLNDMYPESSSSYQIAYADAMRDIAEMNISIDYSMERWTPDYNRDDNTILTEEKLGQYDLIVLQNPVLPYSDVELTNITSYFNNGGNILILGTRHQALCTDSINHLLSLLNVDIQVKDETVVDEQWVGLGAMVSTQDITNFYSSEIFNGVNKFKWKYGNTFTGFSRNIATQGLTKIVAAAYNGSTEGKGNVVAFGDSHWLSDYYKSSGYEQDHNKLLKNVMNYLLGNDDLSLNIDLDSWSTATPQVNISVYTKNTTTNELISSSVLNSDLKVAIKNDTYSELISMNSIANGVSANTTYNLPYPSYMPYTVEVNITIGSTTYNKTSKILYYDNSKVPGITNLAVSVSTIARPGSTSVDINATLDGPIYNTMGYMTIYTNSYYNTHKSVNKTLQMNQYTNDYSTKFDPSTSDPSGIAMVYVVPKNPNTNYINPNSPRKYFTITNTAPVINEALSTFGTATFTETSGFYFQLSNTGSAEFSVKVGDTEDAASQIRVFVDLFICGVVASSYLTPVYPVTLVSTELPYESSGGIHYGLLTIPATMSYSILSGIVSISTETNFQAVGDYLGMLRIVSFDSEGEKDNFNVYVELTVTLADEPTAIPGYDLYIFLGMISIISVIVLKKKKK